MPARPDFGGLFTELVSQGIDHDLADRLLSTASNGSKPGARKMRERVRQLITEQLIIAPPVELQAKTRLVTAFLGSTGVGKTTTVAKIAGHAAFKMKKRVALISTDMRIGGQEPLMQFGELLAIPAYGCPDLGRLKELVANLADRDLILIDTPGSSPSDLARLAKLEELRSGTEMKLHLVISAATRSEDVAKIVMRFDRFKPNSVIFTKIDETDSKGPVTGDLLRNNISVSYVTNGQRVPDDLMIPTADQLAQYVLPAEPVE
jgi:flagellar biosynthesis protein FlhF